MAEITASVGQNGVNNNSDVRVVQELLRASGFPIAAPIGVCDAQTIAAIASFQKGFLDAPDGRVDPGGTTFARLQSHPAPAATPAGGQGSLTRLVPSPARATLNQGVTPVNNALMNELFGSPRANFSADCQPLTEPRLVRNLLTTSVGQFKVTGLKPAVLSLQEVMSAIEKEQPDVHHALGTAGMLCCRFTRGSTTSISNHSWGSAIDLTLDGILDERGDDKVQFGLTLIAPIFDRFGWYWGAGFPTEDGMHFEGGRTLVEGWARTLT